MFNITENTLTSSGKHHDLYVIKEPLSLGEVSTSSIASLASSSQLMMGQLQQQHHQQQQVNDAALMQPLGSGHPSHVSALFQQAPGGHFLTQTNAAELMPTYGPSSMASHHQLQHHQMQHLPSHQQQQQQQQFFISAPPPEAILYAASASATLHPQIVAFNEKVSWQADETGRQTDQCL